MLFSVMHVKVLAFGVLKDWLGSPAEILELPSGATVADLLSHLSAKLQTDAVSRLRGIAVGVNAEYADGTRVLHDGDEVGLLPPVSGGSATAQDKSEAEPAVQVALTREPIHSQMIVAAAKQAEDGAVVVFDGIVRNHSRGRRTLHLDYEAYEEMAAKQLWELGIRSLQQFEIRQVTMVHRLGRLEIGETSVLIVVASAHRGAAFDACRWLIDTMKQTIPIWKKETFVDGAVWAPGEPFPEGLAIEAPGVRHDA